MAVAGLVETAVGGVFVGKSRLFRGRIRCCLWRAGCYCIRGCIEMRGRRSLIRVGEVFVSVG